MASSRNFTLLLFNEILQFEFYVLLLFYVDAKHGNQRIAPISVPASKFSVKIRGIEFLIWQQVKINLW